MEDDNCVPSIPIYSDKEMYEGLKEEYNKLESLHRILYERHFNLVKKNHRRKSALKQAQRALDSKGYQISQLLSEVYTYKTLYTALNSKSVQLSKNVYELEHKPTNSFTKFLFNILKWT